jgi:hypothetical protein
MINVTNDAYMWSAYTSTTTCMSEYDHKEGRGFAETNTLKIKTIEIEPLVPGSLPTHRVDIPEGAVPVFFRRRKIELDPSAKNGEKRTTIHCIGWKHEEKAVYLFVFDNGSTLLTSDLQAV